MGLHENYVSDEFLNDKQDKKILNEEILEDKHKKISTFIDNFKIKGKSNFKKKPFFKLGLILIIVGIICLLVLNLAPWVYIKYDNEISDVKDNEFFYYKDKIDNFNGDTVFSGFFDSESSYEYLGVNSDSFKSMYLEHSYILYLIIILGVVFTIIGIFVKRYDFSIDKYGLLHSFFAMLTSVLCVYLIFITVKFLGAEMLLFYNGNFISDNLGNLAIIFITPFFLIFLYSCLLKINFTVLKINLHYFEKFFDEKQKNWYQKMWS